MESETLSQQKIDEFRKATSIVEGQKFVINRESVKRSIDAYCDLHGCNYNYDIMFKKLEMDDVCLVSRIDADTVVIAVNSEAYRKRKMKTYRKMLEVAAEIYVVLRFINNHYVKEERTIRLNRYDFVGYTHRGNSCYIDSLMSALMLTPFNHIRNAVKATDLQKLKYSTKQIETYDTNGDAYAVAKRITELFGSEYELLRRRIRIPTRIQETLSQLLPELSVGKIANPAVAYNLLGELFPSLQISYTADIYKDDKYVETVQRSASQFQIVDFVDDFKNTEGGYEKIQWDTISSPFIVFQNGGNFIYNPAKPNMIDFTILNDTYTLCSVVFHRGMGDGGHYISFLCIDGAWYVYDDLMPQIHQIGKTRNIFATTPLARPVMLFYKRII